MHCIGNMQWTVEHVYRLERMGKCCCYHKHNQHQLLYYTKSPSSPSSSLCGKWLFTLFHIGCVVLCFRAPHIKYTTVVALQAQCTQCSIGPTVHLRCKDARSLSIAYSIAYARVLSIVKIHCISIVENAITRKYFSPTLNWMFINLRRNFSNDHTGSQHIRVLCRVVNLPRIIIRGICHPYQAQADKRCSRCCKTQATHSRLRNRRQHDRMTTANKKTHI